MKVNRKRLFLVIGLSLFTLLLVGVVSAQTGGGYDLTWWTVDGGGGSLSGGGYTLMGTAGQPDAGSVGGGGYTLSGGFWAGRGGGAVCTALTGVSVSGPSSGNTGETLTFTATPSPTGATTPITYTWSSDGLVNANGNQATYRWDDTGTKTVQVTARNCGGRRRHRGLHHRLDHRLHRRAIRFRRQLRAADGDRAAHLHLVANPTGRARDAYGDL